MSFTGPIDSDDSGEQLLDGLEKVTVSLHAHVDVDNFLRRRAAA